MAKRFTQGADRQRERSYLISRIAPKAGESILDLGCGAGEDLEEILRLRRGVRAVGMDRSEKVLRSARRKLYRYIKRGRSELVVGDAGEPLPFPSRSFDAVFSAELCDGFSAISEARTGRDRTSIASPGTS